MAASKQKASTFNPGDNITVKGQVVGKADGGGLHIRIDPDPETAEGGHIITLNKEQVEICCS